MKTFIAFLICLSSLALPPVCLADADAYQITDGDKAFYEQIKKAVLADDFDSFAATIAYPTELHFAVRGSVEPWNVAIRTKAQLKKYQSAIFSERLKNALRNQPADSLSKSWRGIMVGNGQLWFDQVRSGGQTNFTY